MKLKELYERAVRIGMKNDLRTAETIEEGLKEQKKLYKKLKGYKKKAFDTEAFTNPYHDSRILNGSGDEEIQTVLVGIDIDVQEILLAYALRGKGKRIDAVISHHPSARGLAQLDKVMSLQPGLWENMGFDKDIAKGIMDGRKGEVERGLSGVNHTRALDAAKLLNIPFLCLHTVADNCVTKFLQKNINKEKPKKLKDIIRLLGKIPEYRHALKMTGIGPHILVGDDSKEAGKVFVDMTGGTNGPDSVIPRLSQAGIKTIVGMHLKETGFNAVKAAFINYVIAGHISSDNLGMNLLFDQVDTGNEIKFLECSGFKRVQRK